MASLGVKSERVPHAPMSEDPDRDTIDSGRIIWIEGENGNTSGIGGQMNTDNHDCEDDSTHTQRCNFGVLDKHPPFQHIVSVAGCSVTFKIEITGLTYVLDNVIEPCVSISIEEASNWLELMGYKQENLFQIDNDTSELLNFSDMRNSKLSSVDAHTKSGTIGEMNIQLDINSDIDESESDYQPVEIHGSDHTIQELLLDGEVNCEQTSKRKISQGNRLSRQSLENTTSDKYLLNKTSIEKKDGDNVSNAEDSEQIDKATLDHDPRTCDMSAAVVLKDISPITDAKHVKTTMPTKPAAKKRPSQPTKTVTRKKSKKATMEAEITATVTANVLQALRDGGVLPADTGMSTHTDNSTALADDAVIDPKVVTNNSPEHDILSERVLPTDTGMSTHMDALTALADHAVVEPEVGTNNSPDILSERVATTGDHHNGYIEERESRITRTNHKTRHKKHKSHNIFKCDWDCDLPKHARTVTSDTTSNRKQLKCEITKTRLKEEKGDTTSTPGKRGKYTHRMSRTEKMRLCDEAEKFGACDTSKKYGIPHSTLCTWRSQLRNGIDLETKKRTRLPTKVTLEEEDLLIQFIEAERGKGNTVGYDTVSVEAQKVVKASIFKASVGWYLRFMRRNGLL